MTAVTAGEKRTTWTTRPASMTQPPRKRERRQAGGAPAEQHAQEQTDQDGVEDEHGSAASVVRVVHTGAWPSR